MDWTLHHQIARLAWKEGMLDFEAISEILTDLGARSAKKEKVSLQLWEESGWLTSTQLARLLDILDEADQGKKKSFGRADTAFFEPDDEAGPADDLRRAATSRFEMGDLKGSEDTKQTRVDALIKGKKLIEESTQEEVRSLPVELGDVDTETGTAARHSSNMELSPNSSAATIEFQITDSEVDELSEVGSTIMERDFFQVAFDETGLFRPAMTPEELLAGPERYELGRELGRGGGGRVVEAQDLVLGRKVAMKLYEKPARNERLSAMRFLAEAQATSQLEHPNIIPVYDVGLRDDGRLYYTMLLVRHHGLDQVLDGLREGDSKIVGDYDLSRLLNILGQICQAIDYAHDKGVVHRDLKPANIMLGLFGEVLVMDWGLSRVLRGEVSTELSEQGGEAVSGDQTLGTPSYMSPEQAQGHLDEVDERSDVYGLGAILYEMLSLRPPFDKDHPIDTMWSVVGSELIRPGQCQAHDLWSIHSELEEICLKAMSREKADRHQSAREFHDELRALTSEIGSHRVGEHLEAAEKAMERYAADKGRIEAVLESIEVLSRQLLPWDGIEKKRPLWRMEDELDELRVDLEETFGEAEAGFQQALAMIPDSAEAIEGLADLYWQGYREAEAGKNAARQAYFRAMLKKVDKERYRQRFGGQAKVKIETKPLKAKATLFPYEEIDRRLVVADERSLGTCPLEVADLKPGSYLLVLQSKGRIVVRAPLFVESGEELNLRIFLPDGEQNNSEFAFIPGGYCLVGGDSEMQPKGPMKKVGVPSFFCARLPVTFRQYLEFLDDLGPERAEKFLPRSPGDDLALVRYEEGEEKWKPLAQRLGISESGGDGTLKEVDCWGFAVVGITFHDAQAYCRWRSDRDGRKYRLPREEEWEKAGRGVDGRTFPWGDRFDATFCKMRYSRPHGSGLEPVGIFVDDASPYGVRDLSGGVQEWCSGKDGAEMQPIRGGAWSLEERFCRLASQRDKSVQTRSLDLGMRLVFAAETDDWTATHRVPTKA